MPHLATWALPHLLDFHGDNTQFLNVDKNAFFSFYIIVQVK